jgi:two-component system response regulator AtoC
MTALCGASQERLPEQGLLSETRDFPHMAKKSPAPRVLVVDDEPLIRWSLVETLVERGCEVGEAGDGLSAIRALRDSAAPFDVVLLDFRLPDSSDLGLLSTLRALAPRTSMILMTAFGTPEIAQGALDLGAFRVVSKPFAVNDMAALVLQARDERPL